MSPKHPQAAVETSCENRAIIYAQNERALQAQLHLRFQEISLLTNELERHRAQIDRLLNSTSWKITAPLRRLGNLLRKPR
jgi:hypothetical protein